VVEGAAGAGIATEVGAAGGFAIAACVGAAGAALWAACAVSVGRDPVARNAATAPPTSTTPIAAATTARACPGFVGVAAEISAAIGLAVCGADPSIGDDV
jgi:hypothetical protein